MPSIEINNCRTGRTTRQLQAAPLGAVYVCRDLRQVRYTRDLARLLHREDLEIVGPSWLEYRWQGRRLSAVILDHAAMLSQEHFDLYRIIQQYIRPLHPSDQEAS